MYSLTGRRNLDLTERAARPTAAAAMRGIALLLLIAAPFWAGCASTAGGRQPLFDPSGRRLFNPDYKCPLTDSNYQCPLSGKRDKGTKALPASKEPKIQEGNAPSACDISPWKNVSADSSTLVTPRDTDRWTAQLPNGGVLFPKYLEASGPKVVMEPRTIIAQVGTEVVMVASYIGPGNEYLQTGQQLEWNLDGTGHFLTSNPPGGSCLNFDSTSTRRVSAKQMYTSTSSRLWRIHRGTSTPLDDITILRGQSWATVQSAEEGTTAVSVYANNIDNWGNRTASGQIHWIDAMFRFPISTVTPVGQTVDLTTSVFRKTVPQPRSGWIVRYEVLSGPAAGFGPNNSPAIEIETDQYGQATVPFSQTSGGPGTNNIKIQVIRPAGNGAERVVVDEKTISQFWSGDAIFNLGFKGPQTGTPGSRQSYEMEVTNLSPMPQDAIVRVSLPAGTRIAGSTPTVSGYEGRTAVWELNALPARSRQLIAFDLDIDTDGILSFNARVDQRGASYTTPTDLPPSTPPDDGDYASPIRIPDSPPAPYDSSPPAATTAPTSPSDAASTAPSLTETVPPPPAATVPDTGHIVLEADMFPAKISAGREFNGRVRVTKTGDVPNTAISLILPDGIYFLQKDSSGQTVNRYTGNPDPVVFNDFNYGEDYALYFTADRMGAKDIRIRVINRDTNEVLARKEVSVEIVP